MLKNCVIYLLKKQEVGVNENARQALIKPEKGKAQVKTKAFE